MMFNSVSDCVMPKTNEEACEGISNTQPIKQQLSTFLPNDHLLSACEYGILLQIQQAVAEGADVNCLASTGLVPVMLAILHNHYDVVNWLLFLENLDVNYGQHSGDQG
jgi:ankyrin repeat protein